MAKQKKIAYESFQSAKPNGNFMMLYWDMLDGEAWQELTSTDIQLYLLMLRKYQRKVTNGIVWETNKDNISITQYDHKDKNGNIIKGYSNYMTGRAFRKSIDHLIELGFIKLVRNGYATRQANLYGFNDMWQKYGTKDFHIKDEWFRNLEQRNKYRRNK